MHSPRLNISPPFAVLIGAILMSLAVAASLLIVTRANDGDVIIISDPATYQVVVEIRGAVLEPGVYRLTQDARLGELLAAAGGASADADLAPHNLARRLADAEIVVINRLGPATPVVAEHRDEQETSEPTNYKVNINTATQSELESLPGIGPVLAQRIIDYRLANGPFTDVAQLTQVQGISENVLAEIEILITSGP